MIEVIELNERLAKIFFTINELASVWRTQPQIIKRYIRWGPTDIKGGRLKVSQGGIIRLPDIIEFIETNRASKRYHTWLNYLKEELER